uniref:Sema domain-containing protein n=1 Tax=Junco hyemalis TaxID=40217 RepID=A0A8C5NIT3_JUNHY
MSLIQECPCPQEGGPRLSPSPRGSPGGCPCPWACVGGTDTTQCPPPHPVPPRSSPASPWTRWRSRTAKANVPTTPPRATPASSWVGDTSGDTTGWGCHPCPPPPLNASLTDGELYSATFNNFLGTEPVILRNLGPHYSMKTEHLTSWLNEPHFVASAFVPESAGSGSGDDDKVYFFFSERAVEYDCYAEQVVARVARVCKGDVGGARTLQKKWTSFLKARLVCSAPEQQLHFNRLQAVFTLPGARWQDTAFFGVFQARW